MTFPKVCSRYKLCVYKIQVKFLLIAGIGGNENSQKVGRADLKLMGGGIFDDHRKTGSIKNERSNKLTTRPKSIYVGQGLGIRQDEEPAFNPKGSAKLVLKDILRQHELENR